MMFLHSIKIWPPAPVYSHAEFLNGVAFKPFYGLGGQWVKPRVRVKMGRLPQFSLLLPPCDGWDSPEVRMAYVKGRWDEHGESK